MKILTRYILQNFLSSFFISLTALTGLFLVFDFFERMRVFVRENAAASDAALYLLYKIPMIVHLMTPVAVLVATLFAIGRLSQSSEITAMRACGASIISLAKPLLFCGILISGAIFLLAETILPSATQKVDEIYQLDIRKSAESGKFSRTHFWYRDKNSFYSIGLYDSRLEKLHFIDRYTLDKDFTVIEKLSAVEAQWHGEPIAWLLSDSVELKKIPDTPRYLSSVFKQIPLLINENPKDFYSMRQNPETMNRKELLNYSNKLASEGVPITEYLVAYHAKLSFPLVNFIVILVAFPFALFSARSGNMSVSFISGVTAGFMYYIVHAISTSLGSAELLPPLLSAWTANIFLGAIGGYLLSSADYSK